MTIDDVYKFLHNWIDLTLNTTLGLGVAIIRENQNGPRPELPYMTLGDPPISNKDVDSGNISNWQFTDEPQDEGEVSITTTYETIISIKEISGNGNLIDLLFEYLKRSDIQRFWFENFITFIRLGNIIPLPNITGNYAEKRAAIDITVSWANTIVYDPSYVGTVEITGTTI